LSEIEEAEKIATSGNKSARQKSSLAPAQDQSLPKGEIKVTVVATGF